MGKQPHSRLLLEQEGDFHRWLKHAQLLLPFKFHTLSANSNGRLLWQRRCSLHSYSANLRGPWDSSRLLGTHKTPRASPPLRLTWPGFPAGVSSSLSDSSSLLSESFSDFLALSAGIRAPPLTWGVTFPAFPGAAAALFPGDPLAGAGEALTCGGFTEGFAWNKWMELGKE